jgi:hypothetical protein
MPATNAGMGIQAFLVHWVSGVALVLRSLQALGPINDDDSVPWTMFNDEVQMGFFDVYDQYLLNILYHPRVRPGMTKDDVAQLAPEIMPAVRAWVASTNARPTPRMNGASVSHDALERVVFPVSASTCVLRQELKKTRTRLSQRCGRSRLQG